jgi:hypothetical protein
VIYHSTTNQNKKLEMDDYHQSMMNIKRKPNNEDERCKKKMNTMKKKTTKNPKKPKKPKNPKNPKKEVIKKVNITVLVKTKDEPEGLAKI